MNSKTQKAISLILTSLFALGGFEALIYILNLNQPGIYLQTAFWLFLFLIIWMAMLFDLHLKNPGSLARAIKRHEAVGHWLHRTGRVCATAVSDRLAHLRRWRHINLWLHYLLVPSFIFWGTISLFYINFGFPKIQQIIALLSALALIVGYMFVKEDLYRKKEVMDDDIFVALAMIKIYASAVLFASSLAMLRRFCLPADFFVLETFAYTFLLIYQALFQHKLVTFKNIAISLAIAAILGQAGFFVYLYWGYNYFTGAIFLSVCYNLLWGAFHYHLDRALTWKALAELLVISALIAAMVLSVTNFHARILDGCRF